MFWTHSSSLLDVPVMEIHGDLDILCEDEAAHVISDAIARCPRLVLDLEKCEFMDIAGLRVLIRAHKYCDDLDGYLILSNPQGVVLWLLDVMHMDDQFAIWDALDHETDLTTSRR